VLTVDLVGTNEAAASIRAKGPRIIQAIIKKINGSMIALQSYIVTGKLSGQVLKHRSGKLANSIRVNPAEAEGATVTASVEGAGGPAWYGRLHEFGGSFVASRRLKRPSHLVTRKHGERVMTGSPYGIHFAQRSFMRSSFAERQNQIIESVREGFREALSNG
jgi:hypothetical protein